MNPKITKTKREGKTNDLIGASYSYNEPLGNKETVSWS